MRMSLYTGKVMLLIDGEITNQMGYNLTNGIAVLAFQSDLLT